jgi:hypothetical protein
VIETAPDLLSDHWVIWWASAETFIGKKDVKIIAKNKKIIALLTLAAFIGGQDLRFDFDIEQQCFVVLPNMPNSS